MTDIVAVVESVIDRQIENWEYLHQETQLAFGKRFVDANKTRDGACWAVYLNETNPDDQAILDNIIASHNDLGLTRSQQTQINLNYCADSFTQPDFGGTGETILQSIDSDLLIVAKAASVAELVPVLNRLLERQRILLYYVEGR